MRSSRTQRVTLLGLEPSSARHQCRAAVYAQVKDRAETLRQTEIDGDVERRHARHLRSGEMRHALDHALRRLRARHRGDHGDVVALAGKAQQGRAHATGDAVNEGRGSGKLDSFIRAG